MFQREYYIKTYIAICQCYDLTICKLNYEIRLVYFKCDRNSVIREQVAYLVIGNVDPAVNTILLLIQRYRVKCSQYKNISLVFGCCYSFSGCSIFVLPYKIIDDLHDIFREFSGFSFKFFYLLFCERQFSL